MTGRVLRVIEEKGFGFILGNEGGEYFFHRTDFDGFFEDLISDLQKGVYVEVQFDPVKSAKGLRAGNVVRNDGGLGIMNPKEGNR